MTLEFFKQWCRNRGGQGGHWPPQYFADQLTLFELGRADYPHLLLLAPQCFSPSGITEVGLVFQIMFPSHNI